MRNLIGIFILTMFSMGASAQELTCEDFKLGTFTIEGEVYGRMLRYDIVRYPDFQEEYYENMEPIKVMIEWTDDCSYILTGDPSSSNYGEIEKEIDAAGGIKVSLLEIQDNCFLFTSSLTLNSETIRLDGKICKDGI